jgi:HPt (histidine-containing phosphotransfer) domain-containing protein
MDRKLGESSAGEASEPPLGSAIDGDVLEKFRRAMGDIGDDLVGTFITTARQQSETLVQASKRADISVVELAAHSLKSSSGTVGALRLAKLCHALELEAGKGKEDVLQAGVQDIATELQRVCSELEGLGFQGL